MAEQKNPFASISTTWHGKGDDLETAMKDAWEAAKKGGAAPGVYRILDISFAADNPITEYSVIIGHI